MNQTDRHDLSASRSVRFVDAMQPLAYTGRQTSDGEMSAIRRNRNRAGVDAAQDQLWTSNIDARMSTPAASASSHAYASQTMSTRTLSAFNPRETTRKDRRKKARSLDLTSLMDATNLQRSGNSDQAPVEEEKQPQSAKPQSRLKRVSSKMWSHHNSHKPDRDSFVDVVPSTPGIPSDTNAQQEALWGPSMWSPVTSQPVHTPPLRTQEAQVASTYPLGTAPGASQEGALPRKLTGWLSNMLHPSSASTSTPTSVSNRALSQSQPSSSSGTTQTTPAPARNPLGLVDRRWFDKAANYLFDTDANVDRSPDDIWLLGVCHEGWRPHLDSQQTLQSIHDADVPLTSAGSLGRDAASKLQQPSPPKSLLRSPKKGRIKKQTQGIGKKERKKSGSPSPDPVATSNFDTRLPPSPTDTLHSLSSTPRPSISQQSSSSSCVTDNSSRDTSFQEISAGASRPLPSEKPKSKTSVDLPTIQQSNGWPPAFYLDFCSRIQLTYRSGFPPITQVDGNGNLQKPTSGIGGGFRDMMDSFASSIGRKETGANTGRPNSGSGANAGLTSDAGWGCMLRTGQSLLANALAERHLGREWRRPLPNSQATSTGQQDILRSTHYLMPPSYAKYARILSWFMDDPSEMAPFSVHKFALEGQKLGKEVGQWFGPSTAAGAISVLAEAFDPADIGVINAMDGAVYLSDFPEVSRGWTRPVLALLNLRLGLQGVNPIYYSSIKSVFTFPQCVGLAGGRPSSSYYFVGAQADSLFYIDPHYPKPAVPVRLPVDTATAQDAVRLAVSRETSTDFRSDTQNASNTADNDDGQLVEHDDAEESWFDAESESPVGSQRRSSSDKKRRPRISTPSDPKPRPRYEALDDFFASAYAPSDLLSFHPDRVRKMAISGLDPSMLLGFLIKNEQDMRDWQERSLALKPAIYSVAEQVPHWVRRTAPSRAPSATQHVLGDLPQQQPMSSEGGGSEGDWDISDTDSAIVGDNEDGTPEAPIARR